MNRCIGPYMCKGVQDFLNLFETHTLQLSAHVQLSIALRTLSFGGFWRIRCVSKANRLAGDTQQGLSVQIFLDPSIKHSLHPGIGQDALSNEGLNIYY
jgi:hypothetical protein